MLRHWSNRKWMKERKYPPKQLQGQEEREWEEAGMKERRNEDGSEGDQDVNMQFRLWLNAMNIPREEAWRLAICSWRYLRGHTVSVLQHWYNNTVRKQCTGPFSCFLCCTIVHQQHLHGQTKTVFSPIGLSFPIHLTLNKLFGKCSRHLQTVYRKQHEIIHYFKV